eukprot:TRINITY_DN4203_c0_g4_i1.p1 TRINITY_DN4203_c0_g4~~TRINITY_DN4203_c0_g4_i1.p1  ORF type:complete len:357 (+),score=91.89 TRINITY_DN4203_c0_g4_i1:47-1072(+)
MAAAAGGWAPEPPGPPELPGPPGGLPGPPGPPEETEEEELRRLRSAAQAVSSRLASALLQPNGAGAGVNVENAAAACSGARPEHGSESLPPAPPPGHPAAAASSGVGAGSLAAAPGFAAALPLPLQAFQVPSLPSATAPLDGTLFGLAQLAEESAQMATSAAAYCANPQDPAQVASVTQAAEQAYQRASWCAKVAAEIGPPEPFASNDVWIVTMRRVCSTAAKVAQDASEKCRSTQEEVEKLLPNVGDKRSKVPCKHFLEVGHCREGAACRFSHDLKDQKPRPIALKRQEECKFFAEGKCIRGAACAWAHGKEELDEITRYVTKLRNEKHTRKAAGEHRSR